MSRSCAPDPKVQVQTREWSDSRDPAPLAAVLSLLLDEAEAEITKEDSRDR